MNLIDESVVRYFYKNSENISIASWWSHLEKKSILMFSEQEWLEDFLCRWISVGVNDTTQGDKDRWEKKRTNPLSKIELIPSCINYDLMKCRESFTAFDSTFKNLDIFPFLGSKICSPLTPTRFTRGDVSVSTSFHELGLIWIAARISAVVKNENLEDLSILEIGGGYGGLYEKLFLMIGSKISNIYLIDIPFNLCLQWAYLSKLGLAGIHNFELTTEIDPTDHCKKIIFVPVDRMKEIKKINFVINTRSFGEMTKEALFEYFGLIQGAIEAQGIMFNINRFEKTSKTENILLREYPYDSYWEVVGALTFPMYIRNYELITRRSSNVNSAFEGFLRNLPPL